jgi:hypothetical protein
MDKETITAVAFGIGLSASCGFRVFVPMLAASIAARAGFFPVNEGFQWLASRPAMLCFGTGINCYPVVLDATDNEINIKPYRVYIVGMLKIIIKLQ